MMLSDWGWLDGTCRETNLKQNAATPNFSQENQAIKRQKLEGGRSRQVKCYSFSFSILILLFWTISPECVLLHVQIVDS